MNVRAFIYDYLLILNMLSWVPTNRDMNIYRQLATPISILYYASILLWNTCALIYVSIHIQCCHLLSTYIYSARTLTLFYVFFMGYVR